MTPRASIMFLFVTPQLWREGSEWRMLSYDNDKPGVYAFPSQASSPRFVASPQLPSPSTSSWLTTFGILSFNQVPISYRGLASQREAAPHKFTPMSGVPMHVSGEHAGF